MKTIVFLIIASLTVIGFVLPGCTPAEENVMKIAVCGPLTDIQGQGHLAGAQMARDEINARTGRVTVNGTEYKIELVGVDTNEILVPTGVIGVAALSAVIDDVDFVVGGFRTEAVAVYREVAMDAHKTFMNCGAATGALQFSVVTNYAKYKYWFKATPYNETFLVKSLLRMTYTIGAILKATLAALEAADPIYVLPAYRVGTTPPLTPLRVHILMEDASWCEGMVAAAQDYLPAMGFNVAAPTLVGQAGPIPAADWATIAAEKPHIILTAFSGSVGDGYSAGRVANGVPALTIGINVRGQSKSHWTGTGGACEGEIMLDTWAEGMNLTANTAKWFEDFVARTNDYPLYTAGTYDAIYAVTDAMEATNSLDSDVLIAYLETHAYTGVGGTTAYYPMPALGPFEPIPPLLPDTWWALNASQAYALYPGIVEYYGYSNFEEMAANWTAHMTDWTTEDGFLPHDIVYGPGWQTGIGSQWQDVGGTGKKVGIWPMDLGAPYDAVLTDQYGCWNFGYPGTTDLDLPIGIGEPTGGMLTVPWPP